MEGSSTEEYFQFKRWRREDSRVMIVALTSLVLEDQVAHGQEKNRTSQGQVPLHLLSSLLAMALHIMWLTVTELMAPSVTRNTEDDNIFLTYAPQLPTLSHPAIWYDE